MRIQRHVDIVKATAYTLDFLNERSRELTYASSVFTHVCSYTFVTGEELKIFAVSLSTYANLHFNVSIFCFFPFSYFPSKAIATTLFNDAPLKII